MIKTPNKVGREGMYLNILKGIYHCRELFSSRKTKENLKEEGWKDTH